MSKVRILGRNIRFSVVSRVVILGTSFLLFPFIVRGVGKEAYGIYLVMLSVTGYFGVLDLGVSSTLTKYVSEYKGKNDYEYIGSIINASFTFYVALGLIISAAIFIASAFLLPTLKLNIATMVVAKKLFFWAGLTSMFIWPLNTFRLAMQGLNLWEVDSKINICCQILSAVGSYFIIVFFHDIVFLFIASEVFTALGGILMFLIIKKKVGLKIAFPYSSFGRFKPIFNFALYSFLSSMIIMVTFQIHNILISYFVSVSAVAVYSVAFNFQNYLRTINGSFGGPPWVIASEMEGQKDFEGQRKLLFRGTRYYSAFFLPIVIIMFFYARPFIIYWMGPGFEESILPARIIILFWLFNGTLEIAGGILPAKGIVRENFNIQVFIALTNIIVGIALVRFIGLSAFAVGLTAAFSLVGFPLTLNLSLRSLKVTLKEYFIKSIKVNLFYYLFVSVVSLLVVKYLYPGSLYFVIMQMALIYVVSLFIYYFVVLNVEDRGEVKNLMGYGKFNPAVRIANEDN